MATQPLQIGILNLMHDKLDTQRRFQRVLSQSKHNVNITFFYPRTHYFNRPVPPLVREISVPLDLSNITKLDAFIITGAPIEKLAFDDITYIKEIHQLIDQLTAADIPQLYVCWGAMAAANYLYGIEKHCLPEKIFGIFHNRLVSRSKLLAGLPDGFLAPHARYAELDFQQVKANSNLIIEATTIDNDLFSFRARNAKQYFLFSHLEYGRMALLKEYQRERNAHPGHEYIKPQNYFRDPLHLREPEFKWQTAQQVFFANWLNIVYHNAKVQKLIKE